MGNYFEVATLSIRKWVSLSAFLGFFAFLLYLYFFTDLGAVALVIGGVNISIYAMAFVAVLGSVVFNSLTWYSLLGNFSIKPGFWRVFVLGWVGIFVDALVPGGWSGDVFKGYLLVKDTHVDTGRTAASIVIKNILELAVTLGALISGLVFLFLNYSLEGWVLVSFGTIMILLALPLIIVIFLSVHLGATRRLVVFLRRTFFSTRRRGNEDSFDAKLEKALIEYHDGLRTMKTNPKSLFSPIVFQIMAWAFDILTLFLIFYSIGYFAFPDKIIIVNSIVGNLQVQGFAFAGFTQIVSSSLYAVLGISAAISSASVLLAGFAVFWFRLVVSFFAFQCTVFSRCIPFLSIRCRGIGKKSCDSEGTVSKGKNDPASIEA